MSDYLFLMESRLSPDQWRVVLRLQKASEALGMTVYLAGGAIRDLICGFPIEDLDFVVEGKALQLIRALQREDARVVWQSDALQAAELEFPGGVQGSVTMARSEDYSKGPRPMIAPAPIITDLKRRDFSINAIGISLNPQSRGLLLDPTNGAGDIERKEIRTLHSRSFSDDPVRMFRAVRFRTRLHFQWEQKTAAQYQAARANHFEAEASGEGLLHELRQISRERNPVEVLRALDKEELLQAMNPRLQGGRVNVQGIAHAAKAAQLLLQSGIHGTSFDLFLYLLVRKLTPRDVALLGQRLEMKKADLGAMEKLESGAKKLAKELMGKEGSNPTRLYHLLLEAPPDLMVLLMTEFPQAKLQSRIKTFLHKYLPLRSHLPEQELQALGVPAGTPRHQRILDAFFYQSIEGKLHGKNDQAKFLKKTAGETEAKTATPQKPAQEKLGTKKPSPKKPSSKKPSSKKPSPKKPSPKKPSPKKPSPKKHSPAKRRKR